MHPEIYRDLVRQRHGDYDREAARSRLAAIARAGSHGEPSAASGRPWLRERLRLTLRRRLRRILLAAAAGVSMALEQLPDDGG